MKKTLLRILISLLIILGLWGCGETYCPAFPEQLLDYIPYSEDSIIEFVNSSNDTLSVVVLSVWKTDSYTIKWNEKCACGADAAFKTNMNEFYSLEIGGGIIVSINETSIINYTIRNLNISNDSFEYRVDGIDPFKKENANLFGDTISIKKDEYYRFNDIVIVRKEGLVSFWDETCNCFWTKIE